MRRFRLAAQARLDLLEIWHYIAKSSIEAANRVGADLDEAIVQIAEMPGMGHSRADVDDPRYRFWSVHSYVIAYRIDTKPLTIARVVHGARDFKKLFKQK